jgi:hypothetical protein
MPLIEYVISCTDCDTVQAGLKAKSGEYAKNKDDNHIEWSVERGCDGVLKDVAIYVVKDPYHLCPQNNIGELPRLYLRPGDTDGFDLYRGDVNKMYDLFSDTGIEFEIRYKYSSKCGGKVVRERGPRVPMEPVEHSQASVVICNKCDFAPSVEVDGGSANVTLNGTGFLLSGGNPQALDADSLKWIIRRWVDGTWQTLGDPHLGMEFSAVLEPGLHKVVLEYVDSPDVNDSLVMVVLDRVATTAD